jgi:hypothetical protein
MTSSENQNSLARFLEKPTRFLFFTGKGGMGETSLVCAAEEPVGPVKLRQLFQTKIVN